MSLTITHVNPNSPVSSGPGVINTNFDNIASEINSIESFLNPTTATLKLTNLTGAVPNGGAEMLTLALTKTSGIAFSVAPGGGAAVMSIDAAGVTTALKIVCTGTGGGDISTFNKMAINDVLTITNTSTTINGIVDLRPANTIIQTKYSKVAVTNANTGASPATPLDLHLCQVVYLDCGNSGGVLSNSGQINLDVTNMKDGQIIEVYLAVKNSGAQSFYNGTSGNEIFAYLDTAGAGMTTISHTVCPAFTPGTNPPTSQSYMKMQWCNIGGGTYRFVILEQLNVTGAS